MSIKCFEFGLKCLLSCTHEKNKSSFVTPEYEDFQIVLFLQQTMMWLMRITLLSALGQLQ